jgi:aspartate aminotransferase
MTEGAPAESAKTFLPLSGRMEHVSEAATLRIAARAAELRAQGRKIVSLSTGEPDFPTPERIKQAGIRAIEQNYTKYTAAEGLPELREIVAEKFRRDNQIETSADRIQISSGGKHALSNAVSVLVDRGDEVIIPSPFWVSYPAMVAIAEGTTVLAHTQASEEWVLSAESLRRVITPRSKAIMLNTPHNPTSTIYNQRALEAIAEVIEETGVYAIVDELYEKLIYDGGHHFSLGSIPEIADQVITVNGLSKAYAMTGWRLGYATGPKHVIEAMNRLQSQAVSHPSSISQRAAIEALTGPQEDVEIMRLRFEARRDLVTRLMHEIPGISFTKPRAAFYVFFDVSSFFGKRFRNGDFIASADDLCAALLEHYGLALVPGGAFGAPEHIRLSFAASEQDIEAGVARIKQGLSDIR